MENLIFFKKFYLDKEKDIIINLYKSSTNDDELTFIIETPYHRNGNLISNLAKVCNVDTIKNEHDMKIITGKMDAFIDDNNNEVYTLRLGGIKIANIYPDGKIDQKAKIPTIIKILMAQTKEYTYPIEKTIVKSYIPKKIKFRTDLHSHTTQILDPDILIALGIKHQVRYPLYYIKKLDIILTPKQESKLEKEFQKVQKKYKHLDLSPKELDRKIKNETYINFADLILNNLENASENLIKIRNRMTLVKDGQAVFTNLEKVVVYRYIFQKGVSVDEKDKITLNLEAINKIEDDEIRTSLFQMLKDSENGSKFANYNLTKDEFLWMARAYKKQGIYYVESTITDLNKKIDVAVKFLKDVHESLPEIEAETGVKLRFLVAVSRTLFTKEQLLKAPATIKTVSKSPYVSGMDLVGEEINDIMDFEEIISSVINYAVEEDPGYTIQLHAGETDAFKDNVEKALDCIKIATPNGKKTPPCRIGHGLYVPDLNSATGKRIIRKIKDVGAVLEFQFTSNVRLNNLIDFHKHPIKEYLNNNIKCVQGTDGYGFYGIDAIDEQIAIKNLLDISDEDFAKMKIAENEILSAKAVYFEEKSKKFKEFLSGRDFEESFFEEYEKQLSMLEEYSNSQFDIQNKLDAQSLFKNKIIEFPQDKVPIVIAGGSFNYSGRITYITDEQRNYLKNFISKINEEENYIVIGHKMQGYEKAIIDISKELNKNLDIIAVVPKYISEDVKEGLNTNNLKGIYVSPEPSELGIYKSFNYEIFERRNSIVVAFDGNSPVSNLLQEAKNGKGKAKIFVNGDVETLREKAKTLGGYVEEFNSSENLSDKIKLYSDLTKN